MANLTSIQILEDGPKHVVVKLEGVLDTSDVSSTTLVDPATLSVIDPMGGNITLASQLRIDKIMYSIEDGLSVNLFWDATSPVRIEELVGRGKMDYFKYQPLYNNSGAGKTGKITYTTEGFVPGSKLSFSVYLAMVKQ